MAINFDKLIASIEEDLNDVEALRKRALGLYVACSVATVAVTEFLFRYRFT